MTCDFKPDYRVIPGATLLEVMQHGHFSVRVLSWITKISEEYIMGILKGDENITEEIAARLEFATKVPKCIWFNLQKNFDERDGAKIIK